jgi:hypothetical protein
MEKQHGGLAQNGWFYISRLLIFTIRGAATPAMLELCN